MRFVGIPAMILFAAVAYGADDPAKKSGRVAVENLPKATGTLEGKKVKFPEKGIASGVKATVSLLESCSDESLYQADELKKAQQGDHVQLVFAKPILVTVMGEKVEVSELVFRLPRNTGVFWLRSGNKVRRYAKYQFQKEEPFAAWLREAQPAH
jgi:hypothetical protein